MWRWQLRSAPLPILLALAFACPSFPVAAGDAQPEAQNSVAPPTDLELETIVFDNVDPAIPVAGQPAQIRFSVSLKAIRTLYDEELAARLRQRLILSIAGRSVPLTADIVSIQRGSTSSDAVGPVRAVVDMAITFDWPDSRQGAGLFGYGGTITQLVSLGDLSGNANVARKPVSVLIPTSEIFYILVAQGIIALPIAFWIPYYINRRRRLEAEKRELRRQQEADLWRLKPSEPPIPAGPGSDGASPDPVVSLAVVGEYDGEPQAQSAIEIVPSIDHIELPDALVAATAAGQVVLVVGEGVSAQAGVLTGSSLLLHILEGLGENVPRSLRKMASPTNSGAHIDDLIDKLGGTSRVLDTLIASASRDQVAGLIAEAVRDAPPSSPLYQALAQFPWRAVVDLTWDGMAERSFVEHGPPDLPLFITVTTGEAVGLTKALRGGERVFLKPYGYLDRPSTLALTTEDLRRNINRSPQFQRTLGGLLQSQSFLFVGLETELLEQFLNIASFDSEATQSRHFALLPSDPINEFRAEGLSRFGVQLLPFDPRASGQQLSKFLKDMHRAVQRTRPIAPGTGRQYVLSAERVIRLKLESIGPFDSLDLTLYDEEEADKFPGNSPWCIIFGGNGVGKSTILRALALVLAGDEPMALDAGRRLLRAGASQGLIEAQVGEQVLRTRLVRDRTTVIVTSSQPTPVQTGSTLVLGFPALRGARSSEPAGPSATAEVSDPDPADLVALISGEVDSRLSDFKQWLVNVLVLADTGSIRALAMRSLLNDIIKDMVPGQINALAPLAKDDFVIRVETPEGVIPFDDLSQGMASVFNWVGLLVQRLFTICDRSEKPQHEPAIVIIDEIDAHLHPEWQRRLVTLTRQYFPQLQVIATSHSPLLAGALRRHEMTVLERNNETNQVERLTAVGETYGLPSQDIMTSPVFGMSTDRNPDVAQLINDYFQIFEKSYRSVEEEAELVRLRRSLRDFRYAQPIEPVRLDLSAEAVADLSARIGSAAR